MLEIGCGSGGSLQYHGERKAAELWGIDRGCLTAAKPA